MSRKRNSRGQFTSGGSLTGGSGDVKPQYLTGFTTAPVSGTDYSVTEIIVPGIVLSGTDQATVTEILSVDWYLGILDLADLTAIHFGYLNTRVTHQTDDPVSLVTIQADLRDPGTFGFGLVQRELTGTAGITDSVMPLHLDLTDQNGNGFLVGSNRMILTTGAFGNATAAGGVVKILYRLSNVGIREYVGIVAGQAFS